MHSRRWRGAALPVIATLATLATLATAAALAVACSDTSSSGGTTTSPGDNVTNDTRDAEPRPPANPDPGDGSELVGQPDAYGSVESDGSYADGGSTVAPYPGVSECSTCSCPAATGYCFGGATPRKDPMRADRADLIKPEGTTDAGPPCPIVAAGSLGCSALPSGATDCASLVSTLQTTYACYLVCAYNGTQMTVYCPNP